MRLKFLPSFVKRKGRITKKQLLNLNYLPHYLVTNIDDVIADSHKYKKCILKLHTLCRGDNYSNKAKFLCAYCIYKSSLMI